MFKLDALQVKPWYVQLAAFGVVALLVYGAFWYLVTRDTRSETSEIEVKVEQLRRDNAGAVVASQRLSEFKANYERAKADYEDLKALLPEQRELTMVLQNVQDRARGRLTLTKFTPKDEVQQDFYTGKPVEVGVTGNYNNLGQFFAQMASYQRIVSITDFKVVKLKADQKDKQLDGQTVSAEFLLTAYYVSPEKLNAAPPAGRAPGAQPAQAAADAPRVQPTLTTSAPEAPRVQNALSSPEAAAASIQARSPQYAAVSEKVTAATHAALNSAASETGGHGRPVPPPGGRSDSYWANKDKINAAVKGAGDGCYTLGQNPDGTFTRVSRPCSTSR
jgi:Tfp pilus assembly protein PilO